MNDIRKLMETLQRIDEGFFSELDMELKDLYSRNPEVTPVQVVGHLRKVMGAEAAKYMSDQFERGTFDSSVYMQEEVGDIEFLQYPEGYEPPPAPEKHVMDKYDWTMYLQDDVANMMHSLVHKIQHHNIWDKGVELAGSEEEFLRTIQYEAEHIMDRYRDSGDGIGSSDMNYFVRAIFRDLGEDDIWGWDKKKEGLGEEDHYRSHHPKYKGDDWSKDEHGQFLDKMEKRGLKKATRGSLKSDDEMERDKTNRYAKYNDAIRGREGLGEENSDTYQRPYENTKEWMGKKVVITSCRDKSLVGEWGVVVDIDKYRNEEGEWEMKYVLDMPDGMDVTLYPSEWSYDQIELVKDADPMGDFMLQNPFEGLEEEVIEVPAGLRGEEGSHLSSRDAEQFIDSLGSEDTPDTEVIDPDSGDVLDWPDKSTRRAQRDAEYQAQKEREEEEAWDTPMLYSFDLKKHGFEAWDRINEFRFDEEFTDHYDVEWANIENLVDNPEQYYEGDYDISVDMPVKISRKDGKKFDKQDRDNFKELYKIFRIATYNISVAYAGSSNNGTVAHFYPTFF